MTENERREAEYRSILKMAGVTDAPAKQEENPQEKPAKKTSKGKK